MDGSTLPADLKISAATPVEAVTSLTFFRFPTVKDQLWAFSQMQLAKGPLARLPGIGFHRLFGTGTKEGFHPYPNFGVYGVIATWPSLEVAQDRVARANVFRRYREHTSETLTIHLSCAHSWGRWGGVEPFEVVETGPLSSPIGVITRATLKVSRLAEFWRAVPDIGMASADCDGLWFKAGMGEVPWVNQITFSIWRDIDAMKAFAYAPGPHRDAIRQVRERQWFKEDLFARFRVLDWEGTWNGAPPVPS